MFFGEFKIPIEIRQKILGFMCGMHIVWDVCAGGLGCEGKL
jgi:hypothetical protein